MTVDLALDKTELRTTIDKLKAALDEARRRTMLAASPAPPPPIAALDALRLSGQPDHPRPPPHMAAQPMAPPTPSLPPPTALQQVRAAPAHQAPPPPPARALPPPPPPPPPPQQQQQQQQQRQQQQQHQQQQPRQAPFWDLCGTTDAEDHCGDAIASMAYAPALEGLPGGGGHAGWLFTASRGLLQLWECSPSGGRGEAPLLMMHSQAVDYLPACMEVERATRALLGSCLGRGGEEWVGLHSLDPGTLLAVKSRAPMPHQAAQRRDGRQCLAVTSLHPFGGPLREHCAASYGGSIVVWGLGSAAQPVAAPQQPRAVWKAHDSLITVLHRAGCGLSLFSGAADGGVHLWSMRVKPTTPLAAFAHSGRVAGVHQPNDTALVVAAGREVVVWDVRLAARPRASVVVDGAGLVDLAVSAFGVTAAVATARGLYSLDLLDSGLGVAPIDAGPLPYAVTQLAVNDATGEVIAGCSDGSMRVYKQRVASGA